MLNKDLLKFIKEARKRGFDDYNIRQPLLKQGWPAEVIEEAFNIVNGKQASGAKIRLSVNIDKRVYKIIDKRAKKNLLSVEEQIEDIVRRSASLSKKSPTSEKLDDLLVSVFSRKRK